MARAKEIVGLDCEASVTSGARLVLRSRLTEMCEFRAAALDWSDIEGVHDMRVASRRLRSAMQDFKPYFRKRDLRPLREGVRKVANALGSVRDEDVAIEALEKLAAEAPPEVAASIKRVTDERRLRREKGRAALVEAISEDSIARLEAEGAAALERAGESSGEQKGAKESDGRGEVVSFRRAARDIIVERWQEIEETSVSLYQPLATEPLHQMRIAAKRLRYAIELFSQCWPEGNLTSFAKELAEMQTSLGELHDCDVWIQAFGVRLHAYHRRKSVDGGAPTLEVSAAERRATVWLMRHFVEARTKYFRDALARWDDWEKAGFAARLHAQLETVSSVADGSADATASLKTMTPGPPKLGEVF